MFQRLYIFHIKTSELVPSVCVFVDIKRYVYSFEFFGQLWNVFIIFYPQGPIYSLYFTSQHLYNVNFGVDFNKYFTYCNLYTRNQLMPLLAAVVLRVFSICLFGLFQSVLLVLFFQFKFQCISSVLFIHSFACLFTLFNVFACLHFKHFNTHLCRLNFNFHSID